VTTQIKLAGEQGALLVEVRGYERPATKDQDDANWLRCEVSIKVGPFGGAFKAAFTTYDLIVLAERLKRALATPSGTVSFQSTEGDIDLDIVLDKRGGAIIRGRANPNGWQGTFLQFQFESDQSYLTQTLGQIEAALRSFPVKQGQAGGAA
jgi:hypothetical protein